MAAFGTREFYMQLAMEAVLVGDLFSFEKPVITVMTGGRSYGSLSQEAVRRGAVIPDLSLGSSTYVEPFIFTALWKDESEYDVYTLHTCATTILDVATRKLGLKDLYMPLIGGNQGLKVLPVVEKGMFEMADYLLEQGFQPPKHHYVTDKVIT